MGEVLYLKFRGFIADLGARRPCVPEGFAEVYEVQRGARCTIGRSSATIQLPHLTVARLHAAIDATRFPARIEDLRSHCGTCVNGVKIPAATTLSPGDEIGIGQILLLVHETVPRSEPRSIDAWATDLGSGERDHRWAAAEALGSFGDAGRVALAPLLRALDDEYPTVRRHAAHALGRIGDEAAVGGLCNHLEQADDAVAVAIVRAIGRIGQRTAAAAPAVAVAAVPAVAALAGRTAVQPAVFLTLRYLGPTAVPVLASMLEHDDPAVIRLAARELAELGPQADTAVPALVQLVRHFDPGVRLDVVLALAELGAGATVAASTLFDVLDHDDDARVRAWAVSGLAAARETRWEARAIAELTHALEDEDSEIRYSAICALRSLGPAARVAAPALQCIACGDDGFHAEAARETLASLGG